MLTLETRDEINGLKREVERLSAFESSYHAAVSALKDAQRKLNSERRKSSRYKKLLDESSKVAQVHTLVGEGLTTPQIAERLFVSVRYVQKVRRGGAEGSKSQTARRLLISGESDEFVAGKTGLTLRSVRRLRREKKALYRDG